MIPNLDGFPHQGGPLHSRQSAFASFLTRRWLEVGLSTRHFTVFNVATFLDHFYCVCTPNLYQLSTPFPINKQFHVAYSLRDSTLVWETIKIWDHVATLKSFGSNPSN
eukprot:Phypoly_transcript_17033.p1 GENE.Phypoly_transcript_17033~~Phypoly_transcript_17033.p1  ORF type:complete len:108 (-),score=3.64 Phypoly_transcript_17033:119-442(-)